VKNICHILFSTLSEHRTSLPSNHSLVSHKQVQGGMHLPQYIFAAQLNHPFTCWDVYLALTVFVPEIASATTLNSAKVLLDSPRLVLSELISFLCCSITVCIIPGSLLKEWPRNLEEVCRKCREIMQRSEPDAKPSSLLHVSTSLSLARNNVPVFYLALSLSLPGALSFCFFLSSLISCSLSLVCAQCLLILVFASK